MGKKQVRQQLTSGEKLNENIKNRNEKLKVDFIQEFEAHEKEDENQRKKSCMILRRKMKLIKLLLLFLLL